ncbi:MAG: MoxR family ATPase [Myxococcales bacterium]|nr:MAG: MoxR family ATPase [Myxococcales bacterium]
MEHLDATAPLQAPDPERDIKAVEQIAKAYQFVKSEVGKVVVGQEEVIDQLLIALFARGHGLFVGVPGLAKTLLISTLAQVLDMSFNRIQFTPDLMPSDITGTDVLEEDRATGKRVFRFIKGPIFCNILLADEINRTPPKTQAALLQAMQEQKVTASGQTYLLDLPFLVFATQNPIEQEGTYPLPEAQLDRFMFMIGVNYPSQAEERAIVQNTTGTYAPELRKVLTPPQIRALQALVLRVPVADNVVDYAVSLARATRPADPSAPDFVRRWVQWGAGPRASQFLILGAKARAVLMGRFAAGREDVRALAVPVLQHRIIKNFQAEAEGIETPALIARLLDAIRADGG